MDSTDDRIAKTQPLPIASAEGVPSNVSCQYQDVGSVTLGSMTLGSVTLGSVTLGSVKA